MVTGACELGPQVLAKSLLTSNGSERLRSYEPPGAGAKFADMTWLQAKNDEFAELKNADIPWTLTSPLQGNHVF